MNPLYDRLAKIIADNRAKRPTEPFATDISKTLGNSGKTSKIAGNPDPKDFRVYAIKK